VSREVPAAPDAAGDATMDTVRACLAVSAQMVAAAEAGDWAAVGRLDHRRAAALAQLSAAPADDHLAVLLQAMRELVAVDVRLKDLAGGERARRLAQLREARKASSGSTAYSHQALRN
jgi:hypothetical protein